MKKGCYKKTLVFAIIILFVVIGIIPSAYTAALKKSTITSYNGNTLYVGGTGDGNYTKIQDAINDAFDGDTVFVYDRLSPYHELLAINKSINLIGEDRDTTVIDGDYKGIVVSIRADDVTVSGFTIIELKKYQNKVGVIKIIGSENVSIKDNIISLGPEFLYKPYIAGVYLEDSSNILIQDNIVFDDSDAPLTYGIDIDYSSTFINVSDNEIYGYVNGIYIASNDNIIYGNYVHNNGDGIDNKGKRNNIINNKVTDNKYVGIRNHGADNSLISGNTISYNGGGSEFDAGLVLLLCENIEVKNNIVSNNNPTGVFLLADNNYITDNHISNNNIIGVYADFHYNNVISRNNFINNDKDAYFEADRPWKNKNQWNENYWNRQRIFPYIIFGKGYFIFFRFTWINIDWNPAKEPYDIS